MKTATGKRRYRVVSRLFGSDLVVLQIEYKETGRSHMYNVGGRVEIDNLPDCTYWEDAKPEDIMQIEEN